MIVILAAQEVEAPAVPAIDILCPTVGEDTMCLSTRILLRNVLFAMIRERLGGRFAINV